jgi:hypothetical protein
LNLICFIIKKEDLPNASKKGFVVFSGLFSRVGFEVGGNKQRLLSGVSHASANAQ